jgi:hypothetical protein
MQQTNLFPPPGALTQPLPHEIQTVARHLLAELLTAVLITGGEEATNHEGKQHEQDPQRAS